MTLDSHSGRCEAGITYVCYNGSMEQSVDSSPKTPYVGMHSRRRVGRSLRAARKQAGLTQAEAAAQAGLTRESLSLIENGQRNAHLETINAILDALGYKLAFLPRTPQEQAMRDHARSYHIIESLE